MANTKMVMKMVLKESGIRNLAAKSAGLSREQLDVALKDLRVAREVETKMIGGMSESFKSQGKTAYVHSVGLQFSLILLGELDGKDMAKDFDDSMIGLIDSFEFAVEGTDLYNHFMWAAENVYTKLS